MKKLLVMLMVVAVVLVSGCATVVNTTMQDVEISSTPANAKVYVDGQLVGQAPLSHKLLRKENHTVRLELEGYNDHEMTLERSVSGWVWGNIVIGGLIGLVVDSVSGGIYKLTPGQVEAEMEPTAATGMLNDQQLSIAVVLHADPSWEKIGNLERVTN